MAISHHVKFTRVYVSIHTNLICKVYIPLPNWILHGFLELSFLVCRHALKLACCISYKQAVDQVENVVVDCEAWHCFKWEVRTSLRYSHTFANNISTNSFFKFFGWVNACHKFNNQRFLTARVSFRLLYRSLV